MTHDPLPPRNHPEAGYWFTHQGWQLFSYSDDYGQGKIKEIFFAYDPNTGTQKEIDISPYGPFDLSLARRVIEMGFPKRIGPSPLTHEDLNQIEMFGQAAE